MPFKQLTTVKSQWLYSIAIIIFGLLAYSSVLLIGIPGKINQLLWDDSTFLFIIIAGLLYFAYRPSGWLGRLTSFTATLIVFAVQLAGIWYRGLNESNYVMGGLLTMTDTAGYYESALRLLEGKTFSIIGSWRPLSHGVLATLLALTQQNLQISIALLVLITAVACFLLAREVQRSHGLAAGVLVVTILFLFYRKYMGTVSTENLGLALGAIALAILWRGTVHRTINLCLLGIFLLTVALNVRAGAFLILPALILWGTWVFRPRSVRFLIGGFSVVLLGFILNSLVFKAVSLPNTMSNSNFSYSLYGLLVGGNWQTVFNEHPELADLNDLERSQRVYQLVINILRTNPFSLVRGCVRAWTDFIWNDFVFSFVESTKVNVVLQILSLIALINCYRQRQTPFASFIFASAIGILLSVPFLPPWDAGVRIYAVTIPFFALLPALGLAFLAERRWRRLVQVPNIKEQPFLLWFFGLTLALLTFGGAITTKILSHPPQFAEISCPAGQEAVYFRYSAGSSLHLVADSVRKSYVPNIRVSDFRKMLDQYLEKDPRVPELTKELGRLNPNTVLINKIDLKSGRMLWVIADREILPPENGLVGACGQRTQNAAVKNPRTADKGYLQSLFYADSLISVSR